ncbi:dTDP-4-dehydrorhamnose reductase [Chitinibacter fontanus]|uniref:dTDP-4-dehydrorhamnose reductase n=1 Tax=Chitinibacter fontanus TaxID=1737446 RepID=A0A7D5V7U4_9NEIS|nr:dTDP-4-dehydrorhamnose reductase [Chitinibacter fontanus]QLI80517.1 dTDP-4-dehydrorhamnose reductase [Chitinibacter fontanus]
MALNAIPKILVTGKNGQVGFELQRSLAVLGEVIAVDREECDLSNPAAIRELVQRVRPDIIVNPAAYTAVDKAESEVELATALNAIAPQVLAEEAAKLGALLVHYSTDYVFDGKKDGYYVETDKPNPQSVYGKTKLAGELAVAAANPRHLIFRTSWVFGVHGGNFLKTMLRLMLQRDALSVINDQYGAPTSASLLADVTAQIVAQYVRSADQSNFAYGTYHLLAAGETSWYGYALLINEFATLQGYTLKIAAKDIQAIPASAYPLPAPRPANSRLDSRKLQSTFGLVLPQWPSAVQQVMMLIKQA